MSARISSSGRVSNKLRASPPFDFTRGKPLLELAIISSVLDKIKNLQKNPHLQLFGDRRSWVLVLFGVIALMLTWSGVKAVQTNYSLQKQIARMQQENDVQELQNNNIKLQNQYYDTDQYLELAARSNFGKAAPGEKVVIVPKKVALAFTKDLDGQDNSKTKKQTGDQPGYQKNFEAWVDFFLHRPSTE